MKNRVTYLLIGRIYTWVITHWRWINGKILFQFGMCFTITLGRSYTCIQLSSWVVNICITFTLFKTWELGLFDSTNRLFHHDPSKHLFLCAFSVMRLCCKGLLKVGTLLYPCMIIHSGILWLKGISIDSLSCDQDRSRRTISNSVK